MARRRSTTSKKTASPVKLSVKDRKTLASLKTLANHVVDFSRKRRAPHMDVPSRSLSNVKFNKSKKILEMGRSKNRRELFNLSQAKSYMQSMLVASGSKKLIDEGKTMSLRGLYYMLKHTIEGTKSENTFDDQTESDRMIEDIEVTIDALREELHLFAEPSGSMVGPLTLVDAGNEQNLATVGSAGYPIPSIVEPEMIQFKKCSAKFILHVEKGTVWRRFWEDGFWKKNNCLVTHGGGQPSRGTRRLLYRLHNELKLPIYCLLDNDPWGYYIYSVIKQGSINLAYESKRMAVPGARYVGIRSSDYEKCDLDPGVTIKLTDHDKKRTRQIADYPWFKTKRPWQKEFKKMLDNDFKLEVEALISKDISYVTEEYVPQRLKDRDFLD